MLCLPSASNRYALPLAVTAALVAQGLVTQTAPAADAPRPNIILIMSDDMGYSDIGCYGGEINTPTLNSLAEGGLRFTQFYNTGRCCPTRASLLTGLYPHQAGVGWMMTDRGYDGYRGDLNNECQTIAEVLKPAGYATYMTGKWHVTKHVQPDGPKFNWPLQRGFDRFYGTITGAGSFFDPGTLTRGNTMLSPLADPEYQPEEYYYTTAISDHAEKFIDGHYENKATAEKPFFLYVAYTAAHWPMHALEKDIAKYKGKYDGGYAPIRAARYQRVKELGLIDPDWEMVPQVGDWDSVEHKQWEAQCMEVYAAMIDSMDQGIGQIVDSVTANGQLDNTLILFLQDNGGCQESVGRNGNFKRPVKPSLPKQADDFISLAVIPKQNRAGVPTLTGPGIMPGPADTYIAYGINWANVSNTPFREYKHYVHEGGIATPLIAHWPDGIKRSGELEHQPGHLIDIMATCVDLAGAEYPKQVGDNEIKPMEGVSLASAFAGKSLNRGEPIFWEHEGNRAVRDGKWKLVAKENRPWELYDMQADRTELNNLADAKPELAKSLEAKWDAYAARANVLPLGAWRGQPRNTQFNRKQKRFELGPNDSLPQAEAPFTTNRSVTVTAKLKSLGQGVIVAQGGSSHGYALYLDDDHLRFAVRNGGKLTIVSSTKELADDIAEVSAVLTADGKITISAGETKLAEGTSPGSISMPIDGLQVGRDEGGLVGKYPPNNTFTGEIESVLVKLE